MIDYEKWRTQFYRLLNDLNEISIDFDHDASNEPKLSGTRQQEHIDRVRDAVESFTEAVMFRPLTVIPTNGAKNP